jgi:osmotically-inducible protein OsmY
MADKNLNQENQSHQSNRDWEKDRSNQQQDWMQNRGGNQSYENGNYSNNRNNDRDQRNRDVGYSGDSAHGMNDDSKGSANRVNYMPDNDDNQGYQGRNSQYGQQGTSGYTGNRGSGMNYNEDRYRQNGGNQWGQTGNNYNNSGWDRREGNDSSFGNRQGQHNDWNNRQSQQSGGGNWGSGSGRQDWGRGNVDSGNEYNDHNQDYRNRNYGNQDNDRYRHTGNDQNRDRNWNMYGGDTSNYGNANQGGVDRNWWDKTKNKVSSWFDNDDDDNKERNRSSMPTHRGKGPSDYRRSEERIREDICDRLTDDDHVDASRVKVSIENDAVILSGTVNSREEKRRAEDLVESISGVRHVENRLRVGSYDTASRHEYTGTTDLPGGIGNESGTTNEIIRNVENDKNRGGDKDRNKTA